MIFFALSQNIHLHLAKKGILLLYPSDFVLKSTIIFTKIFLKLFSLSISIQIKKIKYKKIFEFFKILIFILYKMNAEMKTIENNS